VDFDVQDATIAAEVHPRLAKIQQRGVTYCPAHGGYWLITGYEDVHKAFREWNTFSSRQTSLIQNSTSPKIHESDPPEHTAYRQFLNPLFSARRIKELESGIRARATALLDNFTARGDCELIEEFAHPLPTATFLALMGWPSGDAPLFEKWSNDIIVGMPDGTDEQDVEYRLGATHSVFAYFQDVIADRRTTDRPGDVTTDLLESTLPDGRKLTDDELVRMLWLLMLGGLHTVRGVLGFGLMHLAANPAQRQRLLEDPSLMPGAVEEILRLGAPVAPARVVKQRCTFGGVELQEGDRVVLFTSAANRDPEEFEDPDELLVDRFPNRHLAFGGGPHRCVGSNLGRLELLIALEEIHRRIPDYRLPDRYEPRLHHSQVLGLYELRLQFTPEVR
jgi:cytochrome P450